MNQSITYVVRRHVDATDKDGRPAEIALAFIQFPDATMKMLAIPEGLLATVPDADDFIESEVEAVTGYETTRVH